MTGKRISLEGFEDGVRLTGLLVVAGAALFASFSHMHDWTVDVLAHATGIEAESLSWLGWVNAGCSELIPLLALLSLRRRLAAGMGLMSYALVLVLGGAVMSLAAQLAWVGGTDASWSACFLACLPALTFMLLSKLVVGDLDVSRKRKAADEAETQRRHLAAERLAERIRKADAEVAAARKQAAEAETLAAESAAEAENLRAEILQAEAGLSAAATEAEALRAATGRTETEMADQLAQAVDAAGNARRQAESARRDADREAGHRQALERQLAEARAQLAEQAAAKQRQPRPRQASPAQPAPEALADGSPVPPVDTVSPAKVAAILNARAQHPDASQVELAEITGISDRTIRKVLAAAPAVARKLTVVSA